MTCPVTDNLMSWQTDNPLCVLLIFPALWGKPCDSVCFVITLLIIYVQSACCDSVDNEDRVKNRRWCLKLESSMVLHSLMHSGLSSKKAENGGKEKHRGDGGRKNKQKKMWGTEDALAARYRGILTVVHSEVTVLQPEASVLFKPVGVRSGFLQLLRMHMLVEKLWGRAWSSKGWKTPWSKFQ